jgi:hypothetical protein
MKKIKEIKEVKCILTENGKGRKEYILQFNNFENEKTIEQKDIQKDPLSKQFIEMVIRDILRSNPKLEFYKDVFVMTNNKKTIETKNVSISFYPGFTTSFMETDSGNYLNVTLKNKIIQNETIYDYLNQCNYNDKDIQNEIKADLKGRSFKVSYAKRNYQIDDILFDKTPQNTTINYEGETINLIQYYEKVHDLKTLFDSLPEQIKNECFGICSDESEFINLLEEYKNTFEEFRYEDNFKGIGSFQSWFLDKLSNVLYEFVTNS